MVEFEPFERLKRTGTKLNKGGLHMPVRTALLIAILVLISAATTGCWDLSEPNQIAYVLGSGWDEADTGIEVSVQIPLLKEGGSSEKGGGGDSKGKSFTVVSASGKNIFEATQHIQEKISRRIFPGHRIALFISEGVAKQGITPWLDALIRNPESNTRVRLFVVKGISAKRFLENEYGIERFSSLYASMTSTNIGIKKNMLYDYQREANNPVKCFVLPVVASGTKENEPKMQIHEIALFDNKHKMINYLRDQDAYAALWASGKLTHMRISQHISQGNGTITFDLQKLKRKIKVRIDGERVKVDLRLSGRGLIRENNTGLYLLSPAIKDSVTSEMNEEMQKIVRQVIEKVQKQYKSDIFGFGNEIAWKHPDQWKILSDHWEDSFSKLEVSVDVKLTIPGVGQVGSGPQIMK